MTLLNDIRHPIYPAWPLVSQAKKYHLPKTSANKTPQRDYAVAVVLPDMQLGYFRTHDNTLEPIHDEQALDVALQIVKASKPDQIVLVGDNLDLCEFGKYRFTPAFARTTQAAIDRASLLCAQLRKLAPQARIIWIAGNHEERLGNLILDGAGAAFGLRRGLRPEEWPVMSVPYLCNLDDYGVEYLPGYPGAVHWVNDRLKIIHGDRVASGSSTAHKYLATEKTSVIYGHIHRREWAERTRDDRDGAYTIMAASPGCLARTDGVVPSTRGSMDLDGRPIYRSEDWQTGCGIVTYEPGDGKFVYEQIAIDNGWAFWRGKDYFSTYSNNPENKD